MKNIRQWFTEKGLEKWFQRDNLIILILSGILLFIIALPIDDEEESEQVQSPLKSDVGVEKKENTPADDGATMFYEKEEADYAAYLEERLKEILEGMSGVGKVDVMITLQSSEELVVEKDEPVLRSDVVEQDSQGGSRSTSQLETSESTVYRTAGTDSEPYVVKRILPRVEGVLVVAQGAGSGSISKNITEIVQALFDVEAHKIKVVKMEETN